MATSDVQVANLALDSIGTRSRIASLNEQSAEAVCINLHYDLCRDQMLRAAHWNFARKQTSLTLLNDATQNQTVPQPWLYEYAYPSDCVLARNIMPMFDAVPGTVPGTVTVPQWAGSPVKFIIANDDDAQGNPIKVILTNQNQAILVYTRRITNVSLWDDLFVQGLANLLGARICMALTGDKAMQKLAFDMAADAVTRARGMNGNEGLSVQNVQPEWMKVRGYTADWVFPDGGMFSYGPQDLQLAI